MAEETYVRNQLYSIPLGELQPDPNQPRKYFDPAALEELTASIVRNGVMAPIFFRLQDGAKFIVAGERRCLAARNAGLTSIPALYTDMPNPDEISLIDNLVRSDLNAIEEAEAIDQLMKKHSYQQAFVGTVLSKSKAYISESISLMLLPAQIRDECRRDPTVPKKTLLSIARKKTEEEMESAYKKYREGSAAVDSGTPKVPGIFSDMMATAKKIEAFDAKTLTSEERKTFIAGLQNMSSVIGNALAVASEIEAKAAESATANTKKPSKKLA
ncbi:MAG: ParB/RepB/Spo0J family partition protein [Syntrophales bacterium]|nr:ParB/RepB/Spo0J family partition protein [Syntrophales bacterium]